MDINGNLRWWNDEHNDVKPNDTIRKKTYSNENYLYLQVHYSINQDFQYY